MPRPLFICALFLDRRLLFDRTSSRAVQFLPTWKEVHQEEPAAVMEIFQVQSRVSLSHIL